MSFGKTISSHFENVKEYRYLGITITKNGAFKSEDLVEKTLKRLEILKSLFGFSSTTHKIRFINSYALSLMIYGMRCIKFSSDQIDRVNKAARAAMGSKGKKICLERLLASSKHGGYGLLNLQAMNERLQKTWLLYIATYDTWFSKIMAGWNESFKRRSHDVIGPFLATRSTKIKDPWMGLVENFGNKFIDSNELPVDHSKPEIETLRTLKSVTINGESRPFNLLERNKWKTLTQPQWTKSQTRWKEDFNIDWTNEVKLIRKCNIPDYVKYLVHDAWNTALAVLYKQEYCRVCGLLIRSSHFQIECEGFIRLRDGIGKYNPSLPADSCSNISIYLNYRLHCHLKHDELLKWGAACKTLQTQLRIRNKLYLDYKKVLCDIIAYFNPMD